MVHLVSQRPKLYHVLWEALARRAYGEGLPVINPTQGHLVELGFELCYIFAMVTFVLGSVLFFPSYSRDAFSWGCHLYIVGSLLTAVLSMYDLAESVLWRRVCISNEADHEIVEKFLYVVGSVLFAVGTALFEHPIEKEGSTQLAETVAVTLFFVGSTFFALAAYVNALSLHRRHPCLIRWALVICTCYVLGGVLFCSGTVAFMPGVGCNEDMLTLGVYFFIVGSLLYLAGAVIDLFKRWAVSRLVGADEMAAIGMSEVCALAQQQQAAGRAAARQLEARWPVILSRDDAPAACLRDSWATWSGGEEQPTVDQLEQWVECMAQSSRDASDAFDAHGTEDLGDIILRRRAPQLRHANSVPVYVRAQSGL